MTQLSKDVKTKEIIMLEEKISISESEFKKIDSFLLKGKTGMIRLESGEWINLSFVALIKNKKNSKVFGEDVKI